MKRQETRQYVVQSHYFHKEKLKEEQKERNRKKISLDNIMTKLDKEALQTLESFFKQHAEEGVTLKKFVQFMAETMPMKKAKQFDMMAALCDLFREIDINGDQHLDWDQFIQFIIDHVNARHSKSKTSEILQNLLPRNKVLRFQRKRIVDKFFHTGQITQSFLIRQIGALASVEKGARNIKLFSPDLHCKLKVVDLPTNAGFIIKADYDYKLGLLVGISSNSLFTIWDSACKRAPQLLYSQQIKPRQINLWHLPKHAGWLSQDQEFNLTYWKISKAKIQKIHSFRDHYASLFHICEIFSPLGIISASLDGKVFLRSLVGQKCLGRLQGEHKTPVRFVEYNPNFGGHVLTVSHQQFIGVWTSDAMVGKSNIARLEGSHYPLVCVKFLNYRLPFAVSLDEAGGVRVWNIKLIKCIQIIQQDLNLNFRGIVMYPEKDSFILYGKRFTIFEAFSSELCDLKKITSQEFSPINAEFNTYYNYILITTKMDIRIYHSKTGNLIDIHEDVIDNTQNSSGDITVTCMDSMHRKIYIADTKGGLGVFNLNNGIKLNTIEFPKDLNEMAILAELDAAIQHNRQLIPHNH